MRLPPPRRSIHPRSDTAHGGLRWRSERPGIRDSWRRESSGSL
jgi:hypothetical protein